ncbi:MAG: TrbI/VirB10 family protein [Sphingomicrobium sp.]
MSGAETEVLREAPAKTNPESLVLRARPRPIVRFRRGLIVGISGAATALLLTLTWLALDPPDFQVASTGIERPDLRGEAPRDALANAPSGYGEIPRLGPPLPGDLGRAILEHQRSLGGDAGATGPARPSEAEHARIAEGQRRAAALQAARSSTILVALARTGNISGTTASGEVEAVRAKASALDRSDSNPHVLTAAMSPWTLSAGTIIPAGLLTGLNSDLPGIVIAQVTQNVRDSATGKAVLIPQGARLIGSYDSETAYGQRRALLVWKRIVFPDASSIRLEDVPASDRAGASGVADRVDFHGKRLVEGIALSTLLSVGAELGVGGEDDSLFGAVRRSAQRSSARAGEQLTERNLDVRPTITVRPGWPVNAILHQDLVLKPWEG